MTTCLSSIVPKRYILIILFFTLLWPLSLSAQDHHHSHARNEIGISPGAVYSPTHKNWGFGLHAHYFRTLGPHSRWALGGGVESVFSHDSHWTIGAGARYHILDNLSVALLPGITFLNHDQDDHHHEAGETTQAHNLNVKFSAHIEVVYDLIHFEHFHIGPAIDFSWSPGDAHFMLGIHCAYIF